MAKQLSRALLEKVQFLVYNAQLDKLFWVETLVYASHLMNRLSSSAIEGLTPLKSWSGRAGQDYDLLKEFECPAYFRVKEGKLDPQAKEFVFLGVKRNLKGYKLWDSKNKKFVLRMYVTFDEASMLRPNSQHMKSMKIKAVLQRVDNYAIPSSLIGSTSFGISQYATLSVDHVAVLDAKQVEEKIIYMIAARRTKKNPQKWVMKKHGSQIGELDQLKLKTVVL